MPSSQVASSESKSSPLILFIKDIEKSMVGNSEAYSAFKSKLENVPENVVVIASHTQMDNRKEKVGIDIYVFSFLLEVYLIHLD